MKKKWIFALAAMLVIQNAALAIPASASPIDFADKNIITVIQTKLNESGFDCGTPDGVAGAKTRQAIKDYRAAEGLADSDEIDAELFNALTLDKDESAFVEEVSAVCTQILPASMTLQGITLYNYDLCISIDPGSALAGAEASDTQVDANAEPGTGEEAAEAETGVAETETAEVETADSQTSTDAESANTAAFSVTSTSALTDEILKLEDGADLWDTITISFMGLGEVVSGREDLEFAEGVSPEVKEFLTSYEAFVNEYSEFLETYDQNNFTQQTQYLKYLHKYSEIADQAAEFGSTDLSETDKAYYDAVMARAAKRLGDYAITK